MELEYSPGVEKIRGTLTARMESLIDFYEAMEDEAIGALKVNPKDFKQKIKLSISKRSLGALQAIRGQVASATVEFSQLPDVVRVKTINLMVPIIDKTLAGMEGFKSVYELFARPPE